MKIVNKEERKDRGKKGIKGLILGESGVGKTSLLYTLEENETLFIDLEAGDLSVKDWNGTSIKCNSWAECRDIAVLMGGLDLVSPIGLNGNYTERHYNSVKEKFGKEFKPECFKTLFIDSITFASKFCLEWAMNVPYIREKNNVMAAYGLLAKEFFYWVQYFQRMIEKNVWFLSLLGREEDENEGTFYVPQVEGKKLATEVPGILDEVFTMLLLMQKVDLSRPKEEEEKRVFVCKRGNPRKCLAKDRSGALSVYEKANLGLITEKINAFNTSEGKGEPNKNSKTKQEGDKKK